MLLIRKLFVAITLLVTLAVSQTSAHAQTLEGLPKKGSMYVQNVRTPAQIRLRAKERARILYNRQFQRRTSIYGVADTSTFKRSLPSDYSPTLLKWKGMVLSKDAMRAFYDASMSVGHYIGGAGWRSHETQMGMSSSLAAPAGYSYHEVGLAADIFGLTYEEARALEQYGFNQLPSEYWHYSFGVVG